MPENNEHIIKHQYIPITDSLRKTTIISFKVRNIQSKNCRRNW